ncbi:MAG: hypothetical protein COA42_16490 [Alteromonadaceae bacterium]|nr:MAG: hypothetical protein COA42_16490 [Alteromonadaceae bacterium]
MVILLSPWEELNQLNYALAVFLFVANILTGMALLSLAIYFKYSFLIDSNINLDLWGRVSSIDIIVTTGEVTYAGVFPPTAGIARPMLWQRSQPLASKLNLGFSPTQIMSATTLISLTIYKLWC